MTATTDYDRQGKGVALIYKYLRLSRDTLCPARFIGETMKARITFLLSWSMNRVMYGGFYKLKEKEGERAKGTRARVR